MGGRDGWDGRFSGSRRAGGRRRHRRVRLDRCVIAHAQALNFHGLLAAIQECDHHAQVVFAIGDQAGIPGYQRSVAHRLQALVDQEPGLGRVIRIGEVQFDRLEFLDGRIDHHRNVALQRLPGLGAIICGS